MKYEIINCIKCARYKFGQYNQKFLNITYKTLRIGGVTMENYIGKICPFCKGTIKEGDVVKVCPSCGVPHHESCWNANGGCATSGCTGHLNEGQDTNSTGVCSNCGTILEPDQIFCPNCGQKTGLPLEQEVNRVYSNEPFNETVKANPTIYDNAQKSFSSTIFNIIGLLSGILSAIFGFVVFGFETGHNESSSIYGGDAYTGIQNAAAQTANNVHELAEIVKFGAGSLLLVVGIVVFCYFGSKLTSNIKNEEK